MKTFFSNTCVHFFGNRFLTRVSACVVALALAGCSAKNDSQPTAEPRTDGKIIIKGSHTIGEELAPQLVAAYKKQHPNAGFELETISTGYGLAALMLDKCDIAGASREPIKGELERANSLGFEMKDDVIGYYSVAIVVNPNNPIANLTKEQVRDIFTGKIKNWKDVGGPDAAIKLYIRDPISGTYLGFRELAMDNNAYAENPSLFTDYAQIVEAVAKDPNGIGYSGLDLAKKQGAKAVSVGGIAPAPATVTKGQYPYARVLRFYTNKKKDTGPANDFVRFVRSPDGQKILDDLGFVKTP